MHSVNTRSTVGNGAGWMVMWDLMLGTGEAPVCNDLLLWDLAELLLYRRRVEFNGNDDEHLRGRRHYGRRPSNRCECVHSSIFLS